MNTQKPLSQHERIRRVMLLCCHALRNFAFYKSGWKSRQLQATNQFWVEANGAFLDRAILEWCKLFADGKGKHHWKRVIKDPAEFESTLYKHLRLSKREFQLYIKKVLRYRDKFIAHLDEDRVMYIPRIKIARNAAAFLYDYLRKDPIACQSIQDANLDSVDFYSAMYQQGFFEYKKSYQAKRYLK